MTRFDMVFTTNGHKTPDGTQNTHSIIRCGHCGLIQYTTEWWPGCPNGTQKNRHNSHVSEVCASYIYSNLARLRRIRGKVVFKPNGYDTQMNAYFTGYQDRAKAWNSGGRAWKKNIRGFRSVSLAASRLRAAVKESNLSLQEITDGGEFHFWN